MIEIIPFNNIDLFNNIDIKEKKITKYSYICSLCTISKLLSIEMPIANKRLALRNILDFLNYIDTWVDQNEETLIPIHSKILEEFFSRNKYVEYVNILKDLNIMSKVPYEDGSFYTAPTKKAGDKWISDKGKKGLCSQFRIHNEYLNDNEQAVIILEDDRSTSEFHNDIKNLDPRYINTIKKLKVNITAAIADEIKYFIEGNITFNKLKIRISRIFNTIRKRYIKKGKKVDRIYHSFTNLSKISRKHLNINFKNIDIVNCQPTLLIAYLKQEGMDYDQQYQNDCENGLFYEQFLFLDTRLISDEEKRNDIKTVIYSNIFFGFNTRSLINKTFQELYPKTWVSLKKISNSEISLASRLQNLESGLFNNLIPKRSNFYFTLFDAIYFDNILDKNELEEKCYEYFNNLKIKIKIK